MKNIMVFVCLFVSIGAFAQNGNASHVSNGSTVQVIMDSTMPDFEQIQVIQALNIWNGSLSSARVGCNVSYQIFASGSTMNWPWTNGTLDGTIGAATRINSAGGIITQITGTTVNTGGQSTLIKPAHQGYDEIFIKIAEHELGHTLGETDASGNNGHSVMDQISGIDDINGNIPIGITDLDQQLVVGWCQTGGGGGEGSSGGDQCGPDDLSSGCDGSPIILDVEGEGFHLTSADGGVMFDISGTGHPVQLGWTDGDFHNAFLALPGPDGLVHNGKELFGNFTPQPKSEHPNGFIALAQYDDNSDGIIDEQDAVYSKLRLWIDANHDGVCQPEELHRLPEFGVHSLALKYTESRRTDKFGNAFRYRGVVNPAGRRDDRDERHHEGDPGRWAYDVFFVTK
jgi:hypothetical protein